MRTVAGLGDGSKVKLEDYEKLRQEEWLSQIPPCPTCGVRMVVLGRLRGVAKPAVKCDNVACPAPRSWDPGAWPVQEG